MPLSTNCSCGKQLRVRDELAGKRVKCPACGQSVQIPVLANPSSGATVPATQIPTSNPPPRQPVASAPHNGRRKWLLLAGLTVVVIGLGVGAWIGVSVLGPVEPPPRSEAVLPHLMPTHAAPPTVPLPPPRPPAPVVVAPPPRTVSAAEEQYQKGLRALQRNDLTAAIAAFTEAVRLEPKFAAAYGWRGVCYFRKGDRQTALADFDEAISLNPDDPDPHLYRAKVLMRESKYPDVMNECDTVLRLDDKRTEAYLLKGESQAAQNKWHDAAATYTELIRKEPQNALAYARRAEAYYENAASPAYLSDEDARDACEKCLRDCADALRLDAKQSLAYLVRAEIHFVKKEWEGALADLGEVLKLDPKSSTAYRVRGLVYLAKNDRARALADFTAALSIDPQEMPSLR